MKNITNKCASYFTPYVKIESVLKNFPKCRYVGQFPAKTGDLNRPFTDSCVDVFYNPHPKTSLGHSNYFCVFFRDGKAYIADARHVENLSFHGVEDSSGNIIYSRFQHDFRANIDGVMVDGGSWLEKDGVYSMWGRTIGFNSDTIYHDIRVIKGRIYSVGEKLWTNKK